MNGAETFATPETYENFIYTIPEIFAAKGVESSTVTFVRRGTTMARVRGEIRFKHGFRLTIRERILYDRLPLRIDEYGYEGWRDDEKLYWYDSQPHPHIEELQSTHPPHKHVPPNIKQNRIPAPNMGFEQPNLPSLISEIGELISELIPDEESDW